MVGTSSIVRESIAKFQVFLMFLLPRLVRHHKIGAKTLQQVANQSGIDSNFWSVKSRKSLQISMFLSKTGILIKSFFNPPESDIAFLKKLSFKNCLP